MASSWAWSASVVAATWGKGTSRVSRHSTARPSAEAAWCSFSTDERSCSSAAYVTAVRRW